MIVMQREEFIQQLLEHVEFPFAPEEVKDVESNCGSVFINLHDDSSYFIMIERCEE